jgi:hypothetical protein
MFQIILPIGVGILALGFGAILGYYARQSIARRQVDNIETTLQRRISQVKKETDEMIVGAQEKASQIIERTKQDVSLQKQELFKTEKLLLKKESVLAEKSSKIEEDEKEFQQRVEKLKQIKAEIELAKEKIISDLERVSILTKDQSKKELL